jgi:hypothetical protein
MNFWTIPTNPGKPKLFLLEGSIYKIAHLPCQTIQVTLMVVFFCKRDCPLIILILENIKGIEWFFK